MLEDRTVREGEQVTLKCQCIGNPMPQVSWKKNNEDIKRGEEVTSTINEGEARLNIVQVFQEDEGTYRCMAVNTVARASTECHLTIEVPEPTYELSDESSGSSSSHKVINISSDVDVLESLNYPQHNSNLPHLPLHRPIIPTKIHLLHPKGTWKKPGSQNWTKIVFNRQGSKADWEVNLFEDLQYRFYILTGSRFFKIIKK